MFPTLFPEEVYKSVRKQSRSSETGKQGARAKSCMIGFAHATIVVVWNAIAFVSHQNKAHGVLPKNARERHAYGSQHSRRLQTLVHSAGDCLRVGSQHLNALMGGSRKISRLFRHPLRLSREGGTFPLRDMEWALFRHA